MSSSQTIIENLILKPNSKPAQRIVQDLAMVSASRLSENKNPKPVLVSTLTKETTDWNKRVQDKNDAKIKARLVREHVLRKEI